MKREECGGAEDGAAYRTGRGCHVRLCRFSRLEQQMIKAVIVQIVANVFHISVSQLNSTSRNIAEVAFARQTAMYLTHVVCGLNFSEVGLLFKRDRTTVSHACKCVEDRRDELSYDQSLDVLEQTTVLMVGKLLSQREFF